MNAKKQRQSAAPSPLAGPTWQFEDVTLTRVIESEEALLSPFELYPDCTRRTLIETSPGSHLTFIRKTSVF